MKYALLLKKRFEIDYLIIFFVMFLTGFSSLLYEVVLLLVFSTIIGATEISSAIILSSFLLGLSIGGLVGGLISKKDLKYIEILIGVELLIALFAFSAMYLVKEIALLESRSILQFFYVIILVITPALLMGLEIPVAVRILSSKRKQTHPTGFVYFSDTFGGVLGALLSGLLIIPMLGFHGAMIFGGILNIGAALNGFLLKIKPKLKALFAVLIVLFLLGSIAIFAISQKNYKFELNFFDAIYNKKDFYYAKTIYSAISPFQSIIIANSPYYGNQLYINGELQVSEYDSLIYHEYLVLPAIAAHPNPKKILVIGGGDGGALYQILKYNFTQIDHVELDEKVIEVSKIYLKNVHNGSLDNPRVNTIIEDGRYFLAHTKEKYDIIIIDLPDPLKIELSALYSREFYQLVYNALESDGITITQARSPYYYLWAYGSLYNTLKSVFPEVKGYSVIIPSMSSMGFIMASKSNSLDTLNQNHINGKWYDSYDDKLFYNPKFLREFLENNTITISKDTNPIVHIYGQPNYYLKGILDEEK